jgi:hypothetical protein
MKITLISYSFTWNNDRLSIEIASRIWIEHIKITEPKKRTGLQIMLDLLFNKNPEINENLDNINKNDLIIFIAPIWMWKIAFPLRTVFLNYKDYINKYIFVTLSWFVNPKIEEELLSRLWKKPEKVINICYEEIMQINPKITKKEIIKYKLTEKDINKAADIIIERLNISELK